MKNCCEMATNSNASSVLAKLMGIDKVSTPRTTPRKHRMLSDSYLQNTAFIAKRGKPLSRSDDSGYNGNGIENSVECSEVVGVVEDRDFLCGSGQSFPNKRSFSSSHSSSGNRKQTKSLSERSNGSRKSGKSLIQGSSLSSREIAKQATGQVMHSAWHHCAELSRSGSSTEKSSKIEEKVGMTYSEHSEVVGMVEDQDFLCGSRQSASNKRSCSSSHFSSGDRRRTKSLFERNNGVDLRERRLNGSCKTGKSPIQGSSLSSKEIAKQVTEQVMHSVWHSCAELSRSGSSTEKSSEIEEKVGMTSAHLFDSTKNCETSSFNPVHLSTSRETRKAEKQLSGKWRTRKCSQDEVLVTSSSGNRSTAFSFTTLKGWPFRTGKYLSNPALFPSAWVPRRRARDFTLDKNWCLRPEKRDSKLCSDTEEDNSAHKDVRSISECSTCSLHLEKPCIHQEVSLIFNDSLKLGKENSSKGGFTVTQGHINHEAHKIRNEKGCRHLEKDVSQGRTAECLFLNCSFAPLTLGTGEVVDEDIINKSMPTELWRENLSTQQTACIFLSDKESLKAQSRIKSNASETGSPVSSLEGPEACRQVLIFNVELEEQLAAFDSLENDTHGLQRKLQLIENMSLESGSEGPGMILSSEEGDDGGSVGWNPKDPLIMEISESLTKESCDFSYMVEVLVESGICTRSLEMECRTWFLRGYALEPSVFDLLEKKYGEQVSWEKAERRLLFDRINSGLLEMVISCVGFSSWKKPVAKRFSRRQESPGLIEDELWWLLVNQQEDIEKESDDTLRDIIENERLGLLEETILIAQEIQLMDELIEELCMEICFI